MPSALRTPAPSRNLLRFLRSQHELAFFTPSRDQNERIPLCQRVRGNTHQPKASQLALEASAFPIGPLLRRLRPTGRTARTAPKQFSSTTTGLQKWQRSEEHPEPPPTWQERLWGFGSKKAAGPLKPDDLRHDEFEQGSSMFNNRRAMTAKASLEPRLRCTEVDENGEVILVDGEFKKTELIAKVCYMRGYIVDGGDANNVSSMVCFLEICEKSTPQTCLISLSDRRPFY